MCLPVPDELPIARPLLSRYVVRLPLMVALPAVRPALSRNVTLLPFLVAEPMARPLLSRAVSYGSHCTEAVDERTTRRSTDRRKP